MPENDERRLTVAHFRQSGIRGSREPDGNAQLAGRSPDFGREHQVIEDG